MRAGRIFQDEEIVVVNIGKRGLTESVLREIDNVLRARGVVKVKLLKSFRESTELTREEVAEMLAKALNAEVIGVRGFVIALRRETEKRRA
jgi:Predicted RNA-binding protein containing KH domain, possibly ribosomal protein|uniref:YhbY family RNA-binding protein n=1 Tax=Thermofilum pendens TaxID=2269 RepID=A0A7C3WP75_THEPE